MTDRFNDRDHIAGTALLMAYAGLQLQAPKLTMCYLCKKYPRLCYVHLDQKLCMKCADKVGTALRAPFLFKPQED